MPRSSPDPPSVRDPVVERSSTPLELPSEGKPRPSPHSPSETERVTPWGALALLYEVPARWVRAYLSDNGDKAPWDGSDREFLCGPFSTDVHSPDA